MVAERFVQVELNKTVWMVPDHYENLTPIGSGAYGAVWSVLLMKCAKSNPRMFSAAEDKRTGDKVAIKKFNRPFQSAIHAKRTYRELKLLRHMQVRSTLRT